MADFNYSKIRKFDSDIYVFEFNPKVFPSQIALGVPNKKEPLTKISHNWFKTNGYQELAKINLGFFDMKAGGAEHLGLLMRDGGTISGSPESSSGVECYLTKDFKFVIEQLTNVKANQIKTNVNWGASLSYALLVEGAEIFIAKEHFDHFVSKAPRTLIGQKANKNMILAVADGRTLSSKGLTGIESAQLMKELGCINAINADGGGSSEMVVKTVGGLKVVNNPSDGSERQIGSALIVFTKDNTHIVKEENQMTTKRKAALDSGHGSDTYDKTGGKGVPTMEEHTFNAAVVGYAKILAEYNGIEIILTQPLEGLDVPLKQRTDKANAEKAEILISFHADAASNTTAKGHTAFYWHNSSTSKRLAELWDKYADQIMKNTDRNLKPCIPNTDTDFHMVRETDMPAILVEHAFMTNTEELALLKSDDFRRKSAEVAVRAMCEYFGITFKKPEDKPTTNPPVTNPPALNYDKELKIMQEAGIINSPEYWVKVFGNQTAASAINIGLAFKNMAEYILKQNNSTPQPKPDPKPEPKPETPKPERKLLSWVEVNKKALETSVLLELNAKHGTGTLLKNGYILTAKHVGYLDRQLEARTKNHGRFVAEFVNAHNEADIAVYRIKGWEGKNLPYLDITTSKIKTGTDLMNVGHPKGEKWVTKTGKVCREIAEPIWEFDCSIDGVSGNSGGSTVDQYGEITGVIVQRTTVGVQNGSIRESVDGCEVINVTHSMIETWLKEVLNKK